MIVSMTSLSTAQLQAAAQILTDELPIGWPTLADAAKTVDKVVGNAAASCIAALEGETVVGWGAIIPLYDGHVYELHPLVVSGDNKRRGLGSLILSKLERIAKERGALTLYLGADDETGETSLSGVDLYDNLPRRIESFAVHGTHPSAFYMKHGYKIVGVVPDANGVGRPDILLAKKIH